MTRCVLSVLLDGDAGVESDRKGVGDPSKVIRIYLRGSEDGRVHAKEIHLAVPRMHIVACREQLNRRLSVPLETRQPYGAAQSHELTVHVVVGIENRRDGGIVR